MEKTRIIVQLSGGVFTAVHCSDPAANVSVLDWDDAEENSEAKAEAEKLAREAATLAAVW